MICLVRSSSCTPNICFCTQTCICTKKSFIFIFLINVCYVCSSNTILILNTRSRHSQGQTGTSSIYAHIPQRNKNRYTLLHLFITFSVKAQNRRLQKLFSGTRCVERPAKITPMTLQRLSRFVLRYRSFVVRAMAFFTLHSITIYVTLMRRNLYLPIVGIL